LSIVASALSLLPPQVSVCVGSSEQWICVARLPPSLSEESFRSLVAAYGRVRAAFLMVNERSGRSKGYGLVRFQSQEAAATARQLLEGRQLDGFSLQADWLSSTHIAFRQLHSKCLYVDHLPPDYRDMAQYRKVFSVVRNPPYCQIAMRNGCIQDWGLVEFFDAGEAEQTQERMNGYSLAGHRIRVHYCIPGINAINIHMKVVNTPASPKKKGLFEEGPSSSVYSQLHKLTSQNPVCKYFSSI
jgi:RNA recognition motif-containing protein